MSAALGERAVDGGSHGGDAARPLFLITREETGDDMLAGEAQSLGFRVRRVSLLEISPGADAERLADRIAAAYAPGETGIAWTSRRAAAALATLLPFFKGFLQMLSVPLYAVGAESAALLRKRGVTVHTPEEGLGASHLARFIAERAETDHVRRVIFLHGDRALPDLPEGLRATGIDVTEIEVYRTRFLSPDVSDLESALRGGAAVVAAFFSPSGIEALERLLSAEAVARMRSEATALARGATTHAALDSRGYRHALYPEGNATFESRAAEALHEISRDRP